MSQTVFDVSGPLPHGRAVLEASAGTGKTWTIAALVTRFIVEEGIPIDELLVVTFTRAATGELRERVRSRLAEARTALEGAVGGQQPDDEFLQLIVNGDAATVQERLQRVTAALSAFDTATISTIHGFAASVLRLLGVLPDAPLSPELIGDIGTLRDTAFSDSMVTMFSDGVRPAPNRLDAIASAVLATPDALIVPDGLVTESNIADRVEFANRIRSHVRNQIDHEGAVTYDDLLLLARNALADPDAGPMAIKILREAYSVALIDEFQDTDRVQWEIVSTVFDEGHGTLAIIGDPKQAIYSFRGADITAYLSAAENANSHATLVTNWRSDGPLLGALDSIFAETVFGHSEIGYQQVGPAPGQDQTRMTGVASPVEIRVADWGSGAQNQNGFLSAPGSRGVVAADAAAQVVQLLSSGATVPSEDGGSRLVEPSDIAVLCRKRTEIELMREALSSVNVPSVVGSTGSVLASNATDTWLVLLQALEQPSSANRVRNALVSDFIGWTLNELAGASDDDVAEMHDRFSEWAQLLRNSGLPRLLEAIDEATNMTARLLAVEGGERRYTDIHHIGEILHRALRKGGVRSMSEWLATERELAEERPEEAELRVRRLETDAQAVRLLTIHGAKGLGFPIVFFPFGFVPRPNIGGSVPVVNDPETRQRLIDVSGSGQDFDDHREQWATDQDGEDLRLLYVAMTRTRHHLKLWWAPMTSNTGAAKASLSKVLFAERPGTVDHTTKVNVTRDEDLIARLEPLVNRAEGTISTSLITGAVPHSPWTHAAELMPELRAAQFTASIDWEWGRWSFTRLTADVHDAPAHDIPDVTDDEPDETDLAPADPLPLGEVRGGTRFGTFVHELLEDVDFAHPDLEEHLSLLIGERIGRWNLGTDTETLTAGLLASLQTPLDPTFPGLSLSKIDRSQRLDEMNFELPVAHEGTAASVRKLAQALREHLPADDPLGRYPDLLANVGNDGWRGFLTGSIDLTLRSTDDSGRPRWWVADYKTNRLPAMGEYLTVADYRSERLAEAMMSAHYPLQALLYQVALHRYLQFRVAGYDPHRDLGGSVYFFLRGMTGPTSSLIGGRRPGVFTWQPNVPLVLAVDRLLGGGV